MWKRSGYREVCNFLFSKWIIGFSRNTILCILELIIRDLWSTNRKYSSCLICNFLFYTEIISTYCFIVLKRLLSWTFSGTDAENAEETTRRSRKVPKNIEWICEIGTGLRMYTTRWRGEGGNRWFRQLYKGQRLSSLAGCVVVCGYIYRVARLWLSLKVL
jgi:hypothetical protein